MSYLIAIFIQTFLYSHRLKENVAKFWTPMIICTVLAVASGIIAKLLFISIVSVILFAVSTYILSIIICSQIRISELKTIIDSVSASKQPLKDTTRI
jgi:hypothetical protein